VAWPAFDQLDGDERPCLLPGLRVDGRNRTSTKGSGMNRSFGPEVVLFCGSRNCTEASHGQMICGDIFDLRDGSIVLHGGARGADLLADRYGRKYAREKRLHVARVDALWDAFGYKAGPYRNRAMLMLRPTFAFCYPGGGPGTAGMMDLLSGAGIEYVIRYPPGLRPTAGSQENHEPER
jgi:hypothetical protein